MMMSSTNNNQPPPAAVSAENQQQKPGKQGFYPRRHPMAKKQQNNNTNKPPAPANRKALGDIGNVVNGVRPNNKKPLTAAVRVSRPTVKKAVGAAPVPQPAAAADDQEQVVVAEAKKAPPPVQALEQGRVVLSMADRRPPGARKSTVPAKTKSKNVRKKGHSLTSVLSARSKMACKPSTDTAVLPNLDGSDKDDELAVVDYVEDIYAFYKAAELSSLPRDYMPSQAFITDKMRAILVDWLIEVHHKFELVPETLYLTIHLVDQYMSKETVLRKELQLLGICAMLIACKYEEIWAPEVEEFIYISDKAYGRDQILTMEKTILSCIKWRLTVPTPYVFLVRFMKVSSAAPDAATEPAAVAATDKEMEWMVFFLAELGLMQYPVAISYAPSLLAASAVYAARSILGRTPAWSVALHHHTGYQEAELLSCARLLAECHAGALQSKRRSSFSFRKYSSSLLGAVALKPPAADLLPEPHDEQK